MKKFTEGEWKRSAMSSIVGVAISVVEKDLQDRLREVNIAAAFPRERRAETEANANLIVAAPLMYAALEAQAAAELATANCSDCSFSQRYKSMQNCSKHQSALDAAAALRTAALAIADGAK